MKKIKTTTYNFPVIIEKDEEGFFVADCPDILGCHTQGTTLEEAITNVRDAIKLNLNIGIGLLTKVIKKDLKITKNEFIEVLK